MSNLVFKSAIQKALEASRNVASSTFTPQSTSSQSQVVQNAETHTESTRKSRPKPTIHAFAIDSTPFYAPPRKFQSKDACSGKRDASVNVKSLPGRPTAEMEGQVQKCEDQRDAMEKEGMIKEEEKGDSGAGGY